MKNKLKKINFKRILDIFSDDIGIDLGTANTMVYARNRGIVLNEPSVVTMNKKKNTVQAVGTEAKRMIGKTPGNLEAIRPLKDGVIADYEITEKMLKAFFALTTKQNFFIHPRVVICVPAGVTQVEKRAVMDVAREAGAREAYLIEEPMAAAIGANLNIFEPEGNMIVDIGGGTTEIALISLGGIVNKSSLRVAGDKINNKIIQFIKEKHDLTIGEKTAEEIKISIASAIDLEEIKTIEVSGRNILTGLPINVEINSVEIRESIRELIEEIIEEIKIILEKSPAELLADIYKKGIVLAGGGALIKGLDQRIKNELHIPVSIAENPIYAVVNGIGKLLEDFDHYSEVIISPETDY